MRRLWAPTHNVGVLPSGYFVTVTQDPQLRELKGISLRNLQSNSRTLSQFCSWRIACPSCLLAVSCSSATGSTWNTRLEYAATLLRGLHKSVKFTQVFRMLPARRVQGIDPNNNIPAPIKRYTTQSYGIPTATHPHPSLSRTCIRQQHLQQDFSALLARFARFRLGMLPAP